MSPPIASPGPATGRIAWPKTWGHRGASAEYPENTLASFKAAIREGAHGLESDVHLTKDGRLILFHDARLDRTTDGTGLIGEQNWAGQIEHLRTTALPIQPIPLFEDVIDLLMQPENAHVVFNIDIKTTSRPALLFPAMAAILSTRPEILPRLVLGLWHPSFILPSYQHLPRSIQRFHIGASIPFAREWWPYVDGFSILFDCLVDAEGCRFREDCKRAGKKLGVWTVNDEKEMVMAASWGLDVVLTDLPTRNLSLGERSPTLTAFDAVKREVGLNSWIWPWSKWRYWGVAHRARAVLEIDEIIRDGGPDLAFPSLDRSPVPCSPLASPWPSPALSATSSSTAAGLDSTPVTPFLDLTERAAAKKGELIVPDVRVMDELRL